MHFAPLPMHVPDGFLSVTICVIFWILSVIAVIVALRKSNRELGERYVPLMGVLAAAIFAGQMLNFTVVGGTSGHLLGATLAVVFLGPWSGILIMTCVVTLQALIFQDGGLLALGPNLFNMAVLGPLTAWFVFSLVRRLTGGSRTGILLGSGIAAWVSILAAALACAIQLALSGTSPANIAIPAMAGIHALIGLGEALITVGAVGLILSARPGLLRAEASQGTSERAVWIAGGLMALILAILSPLASAFPDGLESFAEKAGFMHQAQEPLYSLIPDYLLPGVSNEAVATILAGLIGVLIVGATAALIALSRKKQPQP